MRKKPLPRYRIAKLKRRDLEKLALAATHPDSRGSGDLVMWDGGLVPVSELPDDELVARYVLSQRRELQSMARAQDLSLYELNPDDPTSSVLFADSEILFRTRAGWQLGYVQPANFDVDQLRKASRYAQVVAFLHRDDTAEHVVSVLRDHASYSHWKSLERQKKVVRDEDGAVVEVRA